MKKQLSEMTLEELWKLFPIYLTEHQSCWENWYEDELSNLQQYLPMEEIVRICHIGSTSIMNIYAKPIVDIMVETVQECNWDIVRDKLTNEGYLCMSENTNRISLNKGYTQNGFADRVYHLHLRRLGDHDELYFRDYLIEYPQIAKAYEELKFGLWERHEHDRDAYTEGKTDFVTKYTEEAKRYYGKRY